MIRFKIPGQIFGGKNHINITRTGHRYPNKSWAIWRDGVVAELRRALPVTPFREPCYISIIYTPADKRKRDLPAIIDSLFHCFERAEIVYDDCLFVDMNFTTREASKTGAGVEVAIELINPRNRQADK